jgi:hypothetical protein
MQPELIKLYHKYATKRGTLTFADFCVAWNKWCDHYDVSPAFAREWGAIYLSAWDGPVYAEAQS